jgi:hypothetical protein
VPSDHLVSAGFCLAEPGREYVVFLDEAQPVFVDLSGLTSPARAEWFHPFTGERRDAGMVAGGKAMLTPPNGWNDVPVALHVGQPGR